MPGTRSEAKDILPAGTACPGCGGTAFRKETDIIDVWFESGSSHAAVLGHEPGLAWPADLYLEGGDQYRGWFHSSLLVAVGTRGHAPYRGVATNGWTLDPQGKATSKSLGNGIDPIEIAKRLGGEIIRLWVASVDFQEDVTVSEDLLGAGSGELRKSCATRFKIHAEQSAGFRSGAARGQIRRLAAAGPVLAHAHSGGQRPGAQMV